MRTRIPEQSPVPPRIPQRFLHWYCKPEMVEDIEGDIHEDFIKRYHRSGRAVARFYYALDVIRFFRPFAVKNLFSNQPRTLMLQSYFTIALRSLRRDVYGTLLYFLLLVVGISSFAIILIIYDTEVSYDRFIKDGDKVYRATTYLKRGDQEVKWAVTNGYLANILEENLPEVETATKFQTIQTSQVFKIGSRKFDIPKLQGYYTDPDFFEVLDYPLIYGNQATALTQPGSIVISRAYAERFFNKADAIGETIEVEFSEGSSLVLKVTGILKDIPFNSHLQFNMLISGNTSDNWETLFNDPVRGGFPVHVYFKTKALVDDHGAFAQKVQETADRVYEEQLGRTREIKFPIQPLTDIHFNADNLFEAGKPGNLLFTHILIAVGIIIFVIATINFSILYTAKSLIRAKEIGIRKTLGSSHTAIGFRLLAESCLLSLVCTIAAIGFAEFMLRSLVRTHLYEANLSLLDAPRIIVFILIAGLLLGIISGIYVTSKSALYNTIQILKGRFKTRRASFLGGRNLLVILQFALTSILITASFMFIKQLDFVKNKDIGFQRDAVLSIVRPSNVTPAQFEVFRQSLEYESAVRAAGHLYFDFLGAYDGGRMALAHEGDTVSARVNINYIDPGLIPALNLQMVEGRNFSTEIASDTLGIIINEAAKRVLGLDEVVGKTMTFEVYGMKPKVIGVVKDYHFQSFTNEIPPVMLYNSQMLPYHKRHLLIRVNPQDITQSLSRIEQKWQEIESGVPFEPKYLNTAFNGLIEEETKLSKMINTFTAISILVACLGLVGLVSYTNEQRKKEVGIRKVFGASEKSIMGMINGYFFKLIALALLMAIPISVLGINRWLDTFAYHTTQSPVEHILAAVLLIGFALLVTSWRTVKTARSNPVDVLKEE